MISHPKVRSNSTRVYDAYFKLSSPFHSVDHQATYQMIYPESFFLGNAKLQGDIAEFCFPVPCSCRDVQMFSFLLTNIDGLYTFGFCLYTPGGYTCSCILSAFPWFDSFFTLLSHMAQMDFHNEDNDILGLLEAFYITPVPKPGDTTPLKITYQCVAKAGEWSSLTFNVPDYRKRPTLGGNRILAEFYSAASADNMVLLLIAVMLERRILIMSQRISRASSCVHSLMALLHPLHWKHIVVPVLPEFMVDICSCPAPFIVGTHSSVIQRLLGQSLEDLVIFDADKNMVSYPNMEEDKKMFPSNWFSFLIQRLEVSMPSQDMLSTAFLALMVAILGDYKKFMFKEGSRHCFDLRRYLGEFTGKQAAFMHVFSKTQAFSQFISNRILHLNKGVVPDDYFEEAIRLDRSKQAESFLQKARRALKEPPLMTSEHPSPLRRASGLLKHSSSLTCRRGSLTKSVHTRSIYASSSSSPPGNCTLLSTRSLRLTRFFSDHSQFFDYELSNHAATSPAVSATGDSWHDRIKSVSPVMHFNDQCPISNRTSFDAAAEPIILDLEMGDCFDPPVYQVGEGLCSEIIAALPVDAQLLLGVLSTSSVL